MMKYEWKKNKVLLKIKWKALLITKANQFLKTCELGVGERDTWKRWMVSWVSYKTQQNSASRALCTSFEGLVHFKEVKTESHR